MIDLLIAGGGPVGLGTALLADRAGLRVVVAEPRPTPVDKACGEGLMPGAVAALRELGVHPPGRPFVGIRYVDERCDAYGHFRHDSGLGVRRTALHTDLVEAVAAAGIEIVPAAVEQVRQGTGHVDVALSAGPARLRTRYLAAADGLHSRLRDQLGLALPPTGPRRYGLRRHFVVPPWNDFVEVHWAETAEAYVTPVGDDLVGVALLFTTGAGRMSYDSRLDAFPALRDRLAGAPAASLVQGAGPLRQRCRGRVAGRVLLVGDAAGYVDAITGEGVRLGLAAGAELVRCVAADRPQAYERAWLRVSREYRLLSDALVHAGEQPWLRSRIVPAAAALPGVFSRIIELAAA